MDQMVLRDYQEEVVTETLKHLAAGERVMLQLPTGAGKTVCFSFIADIFQQAGKSVLCLVHRLELLRQAADKLEILTHSPVGIIKGCHSRHPNRRIQVASIQSLSSRLDQFPHFDLLIVDEAHHSVAKGYLKVLSHYKKAALLGVSATPVRLDGSGFDGIFDRIVSGPSVKALMDAGHLSQYRIYAPFTMLVPNVSGREFPASLIARMNRVVEVRAQLVRSYKEICDGKKGIVFAVNVDHAKSVCEEYQRHGIPSAFLHGGTNARLRDSTLNLFAQGYLKVLVNCKLFDEGFDVPDIDFVQIAAPTKSLARWLQMVGRVLRPSPDKAVAYILDHADNAKRLGPPDLHWIWSLRGASLATDSWHPSAIDADEHPVSGVSVYETDDVLKPIDIGEHWSGREIVPCDGEQCGYIPMLAVELAILWGVDHRRVFSFLSESGITDGQTFRDLPALKKAFDLRRYPLSYLPKRS